MPFCLKKTFLERIADSLGINKRFSRIEEDIIDYREGIIVSPVQATLFEYGDIKAGKLTSKNNREINLRDLIGDKEKIFSKGFFLNFYLSPKDKHYFRIPYNGKFTDTFFNKGKSKIPVFIGLDSLLHSSKFFQKAIKNNASISCILKTKHFPILLIPVGSLFVNGIHIYSKENTSYKKGKVFGHFGLGSSMLLCFPDKDKIRLLIKKGQKVSLGQAIIEIKG
ncbi:MAG: phosphatidylserine decarboxylase [Nanoarchaeota archaeon]|nr:phosphatidylserine decarboxylase [Nanoarchaeota archaeon]